MRDLQVGNIRVRAENLSPAESQQLGERIALLLTERFAGGAGQRDIGHLQVRVSVHGGESVDDLAQHVVNAVIGAL